MVVKNLPLSWDQRRFGEVVDHMAEGSGLNYEEMPVVTNAKMSQQSNYSFISFASAADREIAFRLIHNAVIDGRRIRCDYDND